MDENDRLSIIIFNHNAQLLVPLLRLTKENKNFILNTIKGINSSGGTNIHADIPHALRVMDSRRFSNTVSSILLLSDGLDSDAQHRGKNSLEHFNSKETLAVHTFRYGDDHGPKLMTDIADLKDGSFYYIHGVKLGECFVDWFGGLISAVAKDVEIRIKVYCTLSGTG